MTHQADSLHKVINHSSQSNTTTGYMCLKILIMGQQLVHYGYGFITMNGQILEISQRILVTNVVISVIESFVK